MNKPLYIERESSAWELIGNGGDDGVGFRIGVGVGVVAVAVVGEDEREIVGLVGGVDVVEVGGAEVDAGTAFQGGEEGGGHVGPHPVRHPVQILARYHAPVVVVVVVVAAAAIAIVFVVVLFLHYSFAFAFAFAFCFFFFFSLLRICQRLRRERE